MSEIRLAWEPENKTPLDFIAERLASYMDGEKGVSLLNNGTMLFVVSGEDDVENAKKVMERAKLLIDFKVVELKEGGYFVVFNEAVAVFVGHEEFVEGRAEILRRIDELKLPDERILNPSGASIDKYLIGVYGRGKLYRDAHNFQFFKRIGGCRKAG